MALWGSQVRSLSRPPFSGEIKAVLELSMTAFLFLSGAYVSIGYSRIAASDLTVADSDCLHLATSWLPFGYLNAFPKVLLNT